MLITGTFVHIFIASYISGGISLPATLKHKLFDINDSEAQVMRIFTS